MQRNTIVTILIVIVLVLGGGAIWYLSQQNQTSTPQDTTEGTNQPPVTPPNPQSTEQGQSNSQQVVIKNSSFAPANLKIKKGTTVTWVNEDTIKHNVVASDPSNTGGLPTANPLLGKQDTYSFTFNEVGTFKYLCTPHASFMKGTVEVTE